MSTITVSRQLGSQGNELALQVAERLGWRRICRDVINQAAQAAGVAYVALADIDELGLLGLKPSTKDWQAYQAEVKRIISQEAAAGQVVIVGRGGQMALAGRPDVLHVRVIAPVEARLVRLQEEYAITPEAARARLEASDRAQARYLRRSYHVRLEDPALYHLVINTGLLPLSQAVEVIVKALEEWTGTISSAGKE